MSQRIVRVQLSNGDVVAVRGKLADIIYWMLRHKERIEPIKQGELSFNWSESDAGENGSFRPTLKAVMGSERFST